MVPTLGMPSDPARGMKPLLLLQFALSVLMGMRVNWVLRNCLLAANKIVMSGSYRRVASAEGKVVYQQPGPPIDHAL